VECPRCGSVDVRRSHRRRFERLLGTVFLLPFRCLACNHRFRRVVLPAVRRLTESAPGPTTGSPGRVERLDENRVPMA